MASSSDRLSYTVKKLTWTTTPKRDHLENIALDNKRLKISAISMELEGNKEKFK